jgi:hypothetical protein
LSILEKLNPASDALLAALIPLVDDAMLKEISLADYGQDAPEHLTQLYRVRDDHLVVTEDLWCPHEVLALTRWGEPEKNWAESDPQYQRQHIMRAFACAVLLQTYDNHDTLAQLLVSLAVLGQPFQEAALRFIAWRVQNILPYSETDLPFNVFALMVLVLQTEADLTAAELETLIDYLYTVEAKAHEEWAQYPLTPWLLGLDWHQRGESWQRLGREVTRYAARYKDTYIELALLDMASQLQRDF